MDPIIRGSRPTNGREPIVRLGHISYSNCFPVHARLLDRPQPGDPELVVGVPSDLNRALAAGEIDVAPCSSIEYARNAAEYRILPDLVIGARGAVHSIVFLSGTHPSELDCRLVAIPDASATSVVLLKILLRSFWGVDASFRWFDQRSEDPFASGADAALFIGDIALARGREPGKLHGFDLGEVWYEHTGLPFAFAVWQANGLEDERATELHRRLVESRSYGTRNRGALAERYADHFGMTAAGLAEYWAGLVYELTPEMVLGLEAFYRGAVEAGELREAPELRWVGYGPV